MLLSPTRNVLGEERAAFAPGAVRRLVEAQVVHLVARHVPNAVQHERLAARAVQAAVAAHLLGRQRSLAL